MPESDDGAVTPAEALRDRLDEVRGVWEENRDRLMPTAPRPIDWSSSEGREHLTWLLDRAGVPPVYREAKWDRCRARQALLEYAERLPEMVERGRGMMILGPVGTGKSSAAALLCRAAVKQGIPVRWEYAADVKDRLYARQGRDHWLRMATSIDLLVWDDLGVGGLAEFEIGLLDRVVERRYQRELPMVVTTNMTREALQAPELRRMVDRWSERGFMVTISGESMRRTWKDDVDEA